MNWLLTRNRSVRSCNLLKFAGKSGCQVAVKSISLEVTSDSIKVLFCLNNHPVRTC